ncbi:MAG TPA: hypothetical protein VGQ57_15085, partial [Polyangiaceae bacterium]|nr:hypothetical protein [Polyangiaceae bacterium]
WPGFPWLRPPTFMHEGSTRSGLPALTGQGRARTFRVAMSARARFTGWTRAACVWGIVALVAGLFLDGCGAGAAPNPTGGLASGGASARVTPGASVSGGTNAPAGAPNGGSTTSGGGDTVVTVPSAGTASSSGCVTTLSGLVTTPAGTLPLYDVMLYVPSKPLDPLPEGASCDTCAGVVSGDPVASALSDEHGRFVMVNVPAGADIPLVVQIGKWRREVTVPRVTACADNPVDPELTRLPKNRSEGHLPRIALSTGALDALECLLLKIGIDEHEFTTPDEPGRVNLYAGRGGTDQYADSIDFGAILPLPELSLWGDTNTLPQYDVVLLSCEGGEFPINKPPDARQRMFDYAAQGGRIFFSHYHKFWLEQGPPPFPDVMTFNDTLDDLTLDATIETTFPKGQALASWLVNVGGSTTPGTVSLVDAQNTGRIENPAYAQRWVYDPFDAATQSPSVKYMTANTPLGAAPGSECGRIVYSDIHVTTGDPNGDQSAIDLPFPTGCRTTSLSPQEKVLVFMFFDLSACVIPDKVTPTKPPLVR